MSAATVQQLLTACRALGNEEMLELKRRMD
eukprot:COSAG01_NODE_17451_length_1150_cov_8.648906_1_plen_29_part_10